MSDLYNEGPMFELSDELGVMVSLISDKELFRLKDGISYLKKEVVQNMPRFPLTYTGLNMMSHYVDYELAQRRGKGIKVVMGESVVCEKEDSPWTLSDWREKLVYVEKEVEADSVFSPPSTIIDESDEEEKEEEGEWV